MVYDVSLVNKMVCDLGIDNNQFHLLCLLSMKERGKTSPDLELYKARYECHHPDKNRYLIAMLRDLEEKGLIENLNRKDELYMYYNADFLHVTPKFLDLLYGDEATMAEELWEGYPKWIYIDSKKVSSRSNTSLEDVESIYPKVIKKDKRLHAQIMQKIKMHYANSGAEMGLEKFIASRHWEILEDIDNAVSYGTDI